jgi:NADP-dependent aldehyde dehydrogenase
MTNTFQAVSPIDNQILDGHFEIATSDTINKVVEQAAQAFQIYRKKSGAEIAAFLEQAATEIENLGDALIERAHLETALPTARLIGERGRTCNQLRLFATVAREGSWVDARIDTENTDIRHINIPLGVVAVFGASNFPLAFSTAGGDTASALAAGCPVVVKGHPAHPGTADLVAKAVIIAAQKTGMPEGVFSLVQGNTFNIGEQLVKHPSIKAVGFTGSFHGGMAIQQYANERAEPIPVFAEMGSTNPVFILPNALNEHAEAIAEGLAASVNLGVGQFCTNPGLTFINEGENTQRFKEVLAEKIAATAASTMLTEGIKNAYDKGIVELSKKAETLASGQEATAPNQAISKVYQTTIEAFLSNKTFEEEVFGPTSLLINYTDIGQIVDAANALKGHLTATVHATAEDVEKYGELFDILEQKVGRLVINGFPTGVEVCHAMVHGGPFPATTAPQYTSVGANGIKRFVRPVCYQNFPPALLPLALKDGNPLGIWRMINGAITKD